MIAIGHLLFQNPMKEPCLKISNEVHHHLLAPAIAVSLYGTSRRSLTHLSTRLSMTVTMCVYLMRHNKFIY